MATNDFSTRTICEQLLIKAMPIGRHQPIALALTCRRSTAGDPTEAETLQESVGQHMVWKKVE
jgi:hypothetical protein